MQSVSAAYERIQHSADKYYETRLIIDNVGTFGESQLMSVSTSIEMFHGTPAIGTAVAAEINVSMLMPSVSIPRMARMRLYIRAKGTGAKSSAVTISGEDLSSQYASYSSGKITFAAGSSASVTGETLSFPVDSTESLTSELIPQGVFFIDTREVSANNDGVPILSIHGYDAMLKCEQEYSSNSVVGDAPDTEYVRAIARAINVTVDPRTWDIMKGYMMPFPLGYSMREILGYIAASYAGSFIMTDSGKLRLITLTDLPGHETENLLSNESGDVILIGGYGILV